MTSLREQIESAPGSLTHNTVMNPSNDPYRLDTPVNHENGEWFAEKIGDRRIHLRGAHYLLIGEVLPRPVTIPKAVKDGRVIRPAFQTATYINEPVMYDDYLGDWLAAARWLGYVPWGQITDERNDPPTGPEVVSFEGDEFLTVEPAVPMPWHLLNALHSHQQWEPSPLGMKALAPDIRPEQAFDIVIVGEKSSLRGILRPIAERVGATLYLPTGDPSDTHLFQVASAAKKRMVVVYVADSDPSGWNMADVLARKLQAIKTAFVPDLEFEVHRAALTPWQIEGLNLPSSPLKPGEPRAAAWREAWGQEQTEVDAAMAFQPQLLTRLVTGAVEPFYDSTLLRRHRQQVILYQRQVQAALDAQTDDLFNSEQKEADDVLAQIGEATDALTEAHTTLGDIRDRMQEKARAIEVDVEEPDPVEPIYGDLPQPLVSSDADWYEQTQRIIWDRKYRPEVGS